MDYSAYIAAALKTEKKYPTAQERFDHALLGLTTEIGEFGTPVKRLRIYGAEMDQPRPGKVEPTPRAMIREELGDINWYLAIGFEALGVEMKSMGDVSGEVFFNDARNPDRSLQVTKALRLALKMMVVQNGLLEQNSWHIGGNPVKLVQGLSLILSLVELAAELIGTTNESICAENTAKLEDRYKGAYSDVAAEARDDKGGLGAQES